MRRSGFLSASSWWSFSVRRLCSRCFFFNSCLYWPSRSRTTDCRRRSYNTPDNGKRLLKKPHQKTFAKCDSLFNSIEKHNMHTVLYTVFDTKQVNLNTSDSGLHHTISLMYVEARHLGFGTT